MSVATATFAARATGYARAVVVGDVLACRLTRLACERHLRDLDADAFVWDEDAANEVGEFLELMPHVKGEWAQRGETIVLEDWQCFVYLVPFGWKRHDGYRRFRRAYVEVPRKNAKSTGTAGLANYMFAADGEFGAEVYSGATTEKQAWEVFGPARLMVKGTPALQAQFGITVGAKNLHILGNNSKLEPIIGKPGDGASPHLSVTDEYHEHQTDDQYDTMLTGMGARKQPMAWVITTAGSDTAGPCYALRSEVADVLEGKVENDELFGIIYTIDDGDAWDSEDALRKANPNMGVSVFADYLISQQRDAINSPRKQSTFKRKHLNVWVGAASPYLDGEKWRKLGDAPPIEDFRGADCYAGVDLSSKIDTTSDVRLFQRVADDGQTHYYVYGRTRVPEERVHEADKRHYAGWVASGHMLVCGEAHVDYDEIEDDLKADADMFGLLLGIDPWNATQVITHMQKHMGEERVVEIPQTVNHLSEPLKELDALIRAGRIHHDGNPAQSWMIDNVTAKEDHKGNVFPRKERPEKKIDFVIALLDALNLALRHPPPKPSRYEDPDAELGFV